MTRSGTRRPAEVSLGGGPSAAAPTTPLPPRSPPPPAADFEPGLSYSGNHPQPSRKAWGCAPSAAGGGESEKRVFPGARRLKDSAPRSRCPRGAGQEAGRGKQSQLGLLVMWQPPGGARGYGGKGRRPRQVRSPTDPQLPRTLARPAPPDGQRPPPQLRGTGARALDRKASQPLRAGARAEGGCARL